MDGGAGLADPDPRRCRQARDAGGRRREHGIIACRATIPDKRDGRPLKSTDEGFELLRAGKVDVTGGSRESLVVLSKLLPDSRVLDGGYLDSYVAVAVPKGRPAALAYASAFVEEAKASGLVRRILDSFGMQTSVIPPAGTKP
jgi:ABC-type amino acid transport substrate-binding protein